MDRYLNISYVAIQILVSIISLVFIWGTFFSGNQEMNGLLLFYSVLLIINIFLGLFSSSNKLRESKGKNTQIMVYAPFLLFIIGGIVSKLGFVLMVIALLIQYRSNKLA